MKIFLLFFADFKLLMFHNNIVKISEKVEQTEEASDEEWFLDKLRDCACATEES